MKIVKLNENKAYADLMQRLSKDAGRDFDKTVYDKILKLSDEESDAKVNKLKTKSVRDEYYHQKQSDAALEKEKADFNQDESQKILDLGEVKKYFDNPKFKVDKNLQKEGMDALSKVYSDKMRLPQASRVINRYKPVFIKSWADSFDWQSVGDINEPFIQALNNPDLNKILTGNENSWVKLYNILYDANHDKYSKYVESSNTLLCNPKLYEKEIPADKAKQIIEIDLIDDGKHREGFNKRLNRNAWSEIIEFSKKSLNIENNNSGEAVNSIKNNAENFSLDQKIEIVKSLKLDKEEVKKILDKID